MSASEWTVTEGWATGFRSVMATRRAPIDMEAFLDSFTTAGQRIVLRLPDGRHLPMMLVDAHTTPADTMEMTYVSVGAPIDAAFDIDLMATDGAP